MYPVYNHNWRNVRTIYIYNKTSIKTTKNGICDERCFQGKQSMYRGADKSLTRAGRKQATATEDFDVHISYL